MKKPGTTARCHHGIANTEAQYNILQDESVTYSETFLFENGTVNDKNKLTLKDYETDNTSKRNFYRIVNNIPDDQLGEVVKASESDNTLTSISSIAEKSGSEKLDTLRSGESVIKHFNFDTSKYNGATDKCVAFWKTLMQTDLKPVKCTLIKGSSSSITVVKQTEERSDYDSGMWYKALVELQRRKIDEAAFVATSQQCKLCGQEEAYSKFKKRQSQKYSKSELRDYEDITCLNYWNPIQKQKVVNEATKVQHPESLAELRTTTPEPESEVLPLTSGEDRQVINEGKPVIYNYKELIENQTFIIDEQYTLKCPDSDPCKCGWTHCQCNNCHASPTEDEDQVGMVHLSLLEPQEQDVTFLPSSTIAKDTGMSSTEETCDVIQEKQIIAKPPDGSKTFEKDITGFVTNKCTCREVDCECDKTDKEKLLDEHVFEGNLQKCDICQTYCKCWDHKIEMSKRFIDRSRYELQHQEIKQDKSCRTENEEEKKREDKETFCIICGHNDCNCEGPQHEPHKRFQFIQFDDNMAASLFTPRKQKSLNKVISLTKSKQISQSKFQKKIFEHSGEDVCSTENRDQILSNKPEESKITNKPTDTKNPLQRSRYDQKKFLVTPEQRAKEIINRNKVVPELNKYGIPQVVQYAGGRLAQKPNIDHDGLSSASSEDFKGVGK